MAWRCVVYLYLVLFLAKVVSVLATSSHFPASAPSRVDVFYRPPPPHPLPPPRQNSTLTVFAYDGPVSPSWLHMLLSPENNNNNNAYVVFSGGELCYHLSDLHDVISKKYGRVRLSMYLPQGSVEEGGVNFPADKTDEAIMEYGDPSITLYSSASVSYMADNSSNLWDIAWGHDFAGCLESFLRNPLHTNTKAGGAGTVEAKASVVNDEYYYSTNKKATEYYVSDLESAVSSIVKADPPPPIKGASSAGAGAGKLTFSPFLPTTLITTILVYDDVRFLTSVLSYTCKISKHVIILVSQKPWHGAERSLSDTYSKISSFLSSSSNLEDKVSVFVMPWKSETEQRNFGNRMATMLPGSIGHERVLVVDGDEFWDVGNLIRLVKSVDELSRKAYLDIVQSIEKAHTAKYKHGEEAHYNIPVAAYKPQWLRSPMVTYFGNLQSVVEPPEQLQVLFYVDPRSCRFVSHREIDCEGTSEAAGTISSDGEEVGRESFTLKNAGGKFVDDR